MAPQLMKRSLLVCALGCLLSGSVAPAREAVVELITGRSLQGEAMVTNNTVIVDGTNTVPFSQLRRLSFDLPPPTNAPARGKGNGLLGYYFARTNFQGSVLVRLDERVDFDWTAGEPAQGVPRDGFSVIWTGDVEPPVSGDYRFSVAADDFADAEYRRLTEKFPEFRRGEA